MLSASNHQDIVNQLHSSIKVFQKNKKKVKLGWSASELSTLLVLDVSGSLSLTA